VTKIRPNSIVQ